MRYPRRSGLGRNQPWTDWAERSHSLRVQMGRAASLEADIQFAVIPEIVLHCRKAALSPKCSFVWNAAYGGEGGEQTFAAACSKIR